MPTVPTWYHAASSPKVSKREGIVVKISVAFFVMVSMLAVQSIVRAAVEPDPTDQASLFRHLDKDYAAWLESDAHPGPIRDAAKLLEETNQNSHWTNYRPATELLRQHRSKAAIPLLMKYMVLHAGFGSSHVIIPTYVQTLRILTGNAIDFTPAEGKDRQAETVDAVIDLYVKWWKPIQTTLTVDPEKMTDEQVKNVATELLHCSEKELGRHGGRSSQRSDVQASFEALVSTTSESSRLSEWYPEEVSARMTPGFLEAAGYSAKPGADVTAGSGTVSFPAVPLLAVVCKNGQSALVKRIANDPKQDDAVRLTCLLALHTAGNNVDSKPVISIFDTDTRLDCRTVAILMLSFSEKGGPAGEKLIAALDDDNKDIRLAAIYGLRFNAPRAAVPRLAKILVDREPAELVDPALILFGRFTGDDVAEALAEFIEKTLKDGEGGRTELYRALFSFSTVTHGDWVAAGAHQPEYYEDQAKKAMQAWRATHPRVNK